MSNHNVRQWVTGEYYCSCGRQWDADEGDACPGEGLTEQMKMDAERAAFEGFCVEFHRGASPGGEIHEDPRYPALNGQWIYDDWDVQSAWATWQARASLPVGVPDEAAEEDAPYMTADTEPEFAWRDGFNACRSEHHHGRTPRPSRRSSRARGRRVMASQTSGMTVGQRIAHVGGRTLESHYVEFGSVLAVAPLMDHVARDLLGDMPVHSTAPIIHRIEQVESKYGGLRPAARAMGIDPGYLFRLKNSKKMNPSDDVLAALGLERVTFYRPAGDRNE